MYDILYIVYSVRYNVYIYTLYFSVIFMLFFFYKYGRPLYTLTKVIRIKHTYAKKPTYSSHYHKNKWAVLANSISATRYSLRA